ncbi:DNA polymerase III subunit delta [Patescibacteria group bacterium]|nr:DNA polymerase III subunit delta [Patescibacteria group bacterium]
MFIFLYGEDSYRSGQKLKEIKNNFKEKTDPSGLNIAVFEDENFDLEKFNSAAGQSGFLVAKRLIIIKNLLLNKPAKELAESLVELLDRLKGSENIFVFYENGIPDRRTGLFKKLGQSKLVQTFEPLENTKLDNWIKKYIEESGGKIEKDALDLLLSFVGDNLWQLTSELDKLMAFKNNQAIKKEDVEQFVTAKLNENIFGLSDALAVDNKKEAVRLLKEQLAVGLNEIYLLTMMTRQFRILAEIKSLLSQGVPQAHIASKLKLHPFVVKKALPQANKFTLAKFKKIYQQLVELDKKMKSTSLPPATLLNQFIMQI